MDLQCTSWKEYYVKDLRKNVSMSSSKTDFQKKKTRKLKDKNPMSTNFPSPSFTQNSVYKCFYVFFYMIHFSLLHDLGVCKLWCQLHRFSALHLILSSKYISYSKNSCKFLKENNFLFSLKLSLDGKEILPEVRKLLPA
jgi:hypothetical protein